MRSSLTLLLLGATSLFAQAPTVANARAAAVSPDTIVATINGKTYTAAQVDAIVKSFPKTQQLNFHKAPKQFLEQWAQMQLILEQAEKDKLAQQNPYRDQLQDLENQHQLLRKQLLYNGELTEFANRVPVTTDAMRAEYDKHPEKYREANVKVIYIPYSSTASATAMNEQQALEKAQAVVKRARAGEDFVKLVKENSEDPASAAKNGDFGAPIRSNTTKVPPEIRKAVLAAKPGEVTDPLNGKNGFYIFRVESSAAVPFDQVRDDIFKEIQNAALIRWLDQIRSQTAVKLENEGYFQR